MDGQRPNFSGNRVAYVLATPMLQTKLKPSQINILDLPVFLQTCRGVLDEVLKAEQQNLMSAEQTWCIVSARTTWKYNLFFSFGLSISAPGNISLTIGWMATKFSSYIHDVCLRRLRTWAGYWQQNVLFLTIDVIWNMKPPQWLRPNRANGAMDNKSDNGSEDSRSDSWLALANL